MTETKVVKSMEKIQSTPAGKPNPLISLQLEDIKPAAPLSRKDKSPMNWEYMNQMTSMMVLANLYNCSPGRSPEVAARAACDAADAVCKEWFSRCPDTTKRHR